MRRSMLITTILLLTILLMITSCDSKQNHDQAGLTVYTSIYPIEYAVKQIGGEAVNVESVYPPGVDAHSYEPSTKKMTSIASSDAFFYLGTDMEAFTETTADALEPENVDLIELGKHKELFTANDAEDNTNHDPDPHIWFDPLRMIDMAELIKNKLAELNPDDKDLYQENFIDLKKDLVALDDNFNETLDAKKNKKILVSHAAYGYWEERYGIEQIAIRGITSSDEPSQKDLTSIMKQAETNHLDYVLLEQNSSDHIAEVMQEQLDAKVEYIHNLEVLTEKDIDNHEDYLTLMKHNLNVLDKVTDEGR